MSQSVLEKTELRRADGWSKLPNKQIRILFCARCYWCEEVEGIILAGYGRTGGTELRMNMLSITAK